MDDAGEEYSYTPHDLRRGASVEVSWASQTLLSSNTWDQSQDSTFLMFLNERMNIFVVVVM